MAAEELAYDLFQLLIFPGFAAAFFIGFLYIGIMRKISARMQHRVGPPVWQPFLDFFKLMSKENITTRDTMGLIATLCPIVSFAAMLTVAMFIPIAGFQLLSFDGGLFVVIYLLITSSVFFAISGFAAGNPFASVGSIRELTQLFAYEFPFIVALLTVGVLNAFELTPYFALYFPFTFFAFLMGAMGKLALPPFHIPEAEQEIVAGPLTEYSGPRLALFELARATSFWVMISLGAVLFLAATSLLMFAVSSLILLLVLTIFRVVFARVRISQAFRIYWFIVGPLAVIDLIRAIVLLY